MCIIVIRRRHLPTGVNESYNDVILAELLSLPRVDTFLILLVLNASR